MHRVWTDAQALVRRRQRTEHYCAWFGRTPPWGPVGHRCVIRLPFGWEIERLYGAWSHGWLWRNPEDERYDVPGEARLLVRWVYGGALMLRRR